MNLNYCHLCKTPWDNHSAACTMRPDAEVAALHAELSKLREEHTTAYLAGVEAGKDAMQAEVDKLRKELAEARKKADEYDAMMECIADDDVCLSVSKQTDERTYDMITVERWYEAQVGDGWTEAGWRKEADFPTFAQARAFLARKEAK